MLTLVACSVSEDARNNPKDPKYGSTGSGGSANGADLIISSFNPNTTYTNNVTYNFAVTVKNQGNVNAGSFTVAVETQSSVSFVGNAFFYTDSFAGKTIVTSLAAGASTSLTVSYKPVFPSDGIIAAYADINEVISETNETNNYKYSNVLIQ